MIRIKLIILSFVFFSNCSLNENSRIWNNEKNKAQQNESLLKVFTEKKQLIKEFNPSFKVILKNINLKNETK